MKSLTSVGLFVLVGLVASSSIAASQTKAKLQAAAPAPVAAPANEVKMEAKEIASAAPTTTTAIISTNFADIGRNRMNIQLDAMMTQTTAVSLGFSSQSQKEEREKLAGKPKMSVDRNQFSVGGTFFYRTTEAKYNAALAPALVFQTEKDAVNTDNTNGVKLAAMGLFKPLPRLMFQGGAVVSVLGSSTTTDAVVGMGLMF
jgi:hypothetical protein